MKYKINTYGCQMNVHESEKLAGMLANLGYSPVADDNEEYDFILFNTCCIRDNAEQKILGHIGAVKAKKAKNPDLIVAVVGCMTQQDDAAAKLTKRFPFIDIVLGANNLHQLPDAIKKLRDSSQHVLDIDKSATPSIVEFDGAYRTSGVNAWVNIMYGCNNFCSYCIVPFVRGRERSRQMSQIVNEVKTLLSQGYKEVTLLGQNVNSYGNDLDDDTSFAKLLNELGEIKGKHRIRFMTSHPKDIKKEVVEIIAKHDTISNYIHMPLQAGSDSVLRNMNRKYDMQYYYNTIKMIRDIIPNCGISTDLMVGYPGESEEDFLCTLDAVKRIKFNAAFTYIYSPRKGTVAAECEQLPYKVKSERIQRLIEAQNSVTCEISKSYEGKIFEVLIEGGDGDLVICGRTDCGRLVKLKGSQELIGTFCMAKIISSQSASLHGVIVEQSL